MITVLFETETAIFKFSLTDVQDRLRHYVSKHYVVEATQLLEFLSVQTEKSISIPEDYQHIGYVALDLISSGKGSVICKSCNATYKPGQLKPVTVGHGDSPFSVNRKSKKRRWFRKKRKIPLFGGKGYECPVGHELVSMITWRT
jgi:hypothetical protein